MQGTQNNTIPQVRQVVTYVPVQKSVLNSSFNQQNTSQIGAIAIQPDYTVVSNNGSMLVQKNTEPGSVSEFTFTVKNDTDQNQIAVIGNGNSFNAYKSLPPATTLAVVEMQNLSGSNAAFYSLFKNGLSNHSYLVS